MEYCTGGKEPEKGSKEKMKENSAAEKILTQSCAVLLEWEKEFVTLDESLEQLRKKNFPYRSPVASLLFEYFRHKTFVDGLIRTFARKGVKQEVRILLACAISSCIFQSGIAPESCANVAVELAKKRFGKGCGNFVNALLHSVLRSETLHNIPSSCFPEDLKKHFIAGFGEEQTGKLLQIFAQSNIPVTFRARKEIPENACVYQRLPALDFMKGIPFYRVVDPKAFFNLDLLKDGDVYVQDPATMLALSLLEGPPSGQVLDVCAAPGGKSILLWQRDKGIGGGEKLLVPHQREAAENGGAVRCVEGEENERNDRDVKNAENKAKIDSGCVFHGTIPPSCPSENLCITQREIRMRIIITKESAAPTFSVPATNWRSMVSPMSSKVPPPSF